MRLNFLLLPINDGYPRPLLSTPHYFYASITFFPIHRTGFPIRLLLLTICHLICHMYLTICHHFFCFFVCYLLRIPCDLARADVRYFLAGSVTACSQQAHLRQHVTR